MNNTDSNTPEFYCHMSEKQKLITFVGAAGISLISLVAHSINTYLKGIKEDEYNSESTEEESANNIEITANKTETNQLEDLTFSEKIHKGCSIIIPTLGVTTASFIIAVPLIGGWALTTMDLDCSEH
ncbi:MAG: hypothetical protein K0R02_770 [Rickettsiaceae bacterium]|jgi:hypothetical protein|nr:hypothetical protein [Rickettsiaceae bacterium]